MDESEFTIGVDYMKSHDSVQPIGIKLADHPENKGDESMAPIQRKYFSAEAAI